MDYKPKETAARLLDDYNHVHLMLDDGKDWVAAQEYLTGKGWAQMGTYDYWCAYITQRLILGLGEIISNHEAGA